MFPSKKKKCFVLTQNHEDAFHASLQALGFISLIAKDKNEDLKQMRYFIYFFFFETIKRGNAGGFRQMRRCLRNIFIFFFWPNTVVHEKNSLPTYPNFLDRVGRGQTEVILNVALVD